MLGFGDGMKDGIEGFFAIDEEFDLVSAGEGKADELLCGASEGIVAFDLVVPELLVHRVRRPP